MITKDRVRAFAPIIVGATVGILSSLSFLRWAWTRSIPGPCGFAAGMACFLAANVAARLTARVLKAAASRSSRRHLNHAHRRRKGAQLEHAAALAVAVAAALILEIWKRPFLSALFGGLMALVAAVIAFNATRWWRQKSWW